MNIFRIKQATLKIWFVLMAMLMSMPIFAIDIEFSNTDGEFRVLNDSCVSIIKIRNSNIPSYAEGIVQNVRRTYKVTEIGAKAGSGLTLESINVPNTITSIGYRAFYCCKMLSSVECPNSLISIGTEAFSGCSSLSSIKISDSVEEIGEGAFSDCTALSSAPLNYKSLTTIGARAFKNCIKLGVVGNSESLKSIGEGAFSGCTSLDYVNLGNSHLVSIENNTFDGCTDLHFISLPNSIKKIGDYAFNNCRRLDAITLPDYVTSIGEGAFSECTGISSVNIPNSVIAIGAVAFYGCCNLVSTTIGNSVSSIGDSAFSECSSLTTINLPNSLTNIGFKVFKGCTSLSSIIIPNSVTSIGSYAFSTCSAIKEVIIPSSVTSIGKYAFAECSGLVSLTIGDLVNGNSEIEIDDYAFLKCDSLSKVNFANEEVLCNIKYGNIYSNPINIVHKVHISDCEINELLIPGSITHINKFAFDGWSNLTSVVIPNSVISIGDYAFNNCDRLASVSISNSVDYIGNYAFSGCSTLNSIIIPNSVTTIGGYAFNNCTRLKDIVITNGPETLIFGGFVFSGVKLDSAYIGRNFKREQEELCTTYSSYPFVCQTLTHLIIGSSVTSIGDCAFIYCKDLASAIISSSVTSIGDYAFSNCISLSEIDIPNSVTYIGNSAFEACANLASLTIGKSLSKINSLAFKKCYNIKDIYIKAEAPITKFVKYTFEGSVEKNATLFVRKESVELYKESESSWSSFSNIQAYDFELIDNNISNIALDIYKLNLNIGDYCTIKPSLIPEQITDKSVFWSSFNHEIASVENGTVYGKAEGSTSIIAKTSNGFSAVCSVTVTDPIVQPSSISVNPSTTTMLIGHHQLLSVMFSPSNPIDKTVKWTSSNPSVATVTTQGMVSAKAVGESMIMAVWGNLSSSCKLIVQPLGHLNVSLSQDNYELTTRQTLKLEPNIDKVGNVDIVSIKWYSNNTDVASVSCDGIVTAMSEGEVTITCLVTDNYQIEYAIKCNIKVLRDITEIEELNISLAPNSFQLLVGESKWVTPIIEPNETVEIESHSWLSSNSQVALVQEGYVTAISEGSAIISFIVVDNYGRQYKKDAYLTVIKEVPEEATEKVIFTLSEYDWENGSAIKSIPEKNNILITVSQGKGSAAPAYYNSGEALRLYGGNTFNIQSLDKIAKVEFEFVYGYTFESITHTNDSAIILSTGRYTENNSEGKWNLNDTSGTITIVGTKGSARISKIIVYLIKDSSNEVKAESITLNYSNITALVGDKFQLLADILPLNTSNKSVNWQSSNIQIASVDSNGNVSVLQPGTVEIYAKTCDGSNLTAKCIISATSEIENIVNEEYSVDIFSISGILILQNVKIKDIQRLPSGIYMLRSEHGNRCFIAR